MELDCFKDCSNKVASFDTQPAPERCEYAAFHTGVCEACHKSLEKVKDDPILKDIAVFSGENDQDPLYGLDAPLPHMRADFLDVREHAMRELQYCYDHASLVEAALVSLHHMQVSCCYLHNAGGRFTGVTGYSKNIISFPQDLTELRQHQNYISNLQKHDIVNVLMWKADDRPQEPHRARIVKLLGEKVIVDIDGHGGDRL